MKNIRRCLELLSLGLVHGIVGTATAPLGITHLKKSETTKNSRADLRLQDLEKRQEAIAALFKSIEMHPRLETMVGEIDAVKKELATNKTAARQDFLHKKLSLMSQEYHILSELEQVQQQLTVTLEQQRIALQEYAADESYENLKVPQKPTYTFEDIQQIAQKTAELKTRSSELEKNKLAITDDINKRKRAFVLIQDEYTEKKKQQESFTDQWKEEEQGAKFLSHSQQLTLLDLEVRLLAYKKKLAEIKLAEAEQRLSFTEDQITITKAQLAVVRKEYNRLKDIVRVTLADVKQEEEQLGKKRQEAVSKSDRQNDRMRVIVSEEVMVKQKIKEEQQRFGFSEADMAAIELLDKEQPRNVYEWSGFLRMLELLEERSSLAIEHASIVAQIDLDKAQFNKYELEMLVMRTWHKMTSDGFHTDEEVEQEVKRYSLEKTDLEAHAVALGNARDNVFFNQLQRANNTLERLKQLSAALRQQRATIFKAHGDSYTEDEQKIFAIEERKRREINLLTKLAETYSTTLAVVQSNVKRVENIIEELRSKSFWRKSEQSIRLNKLPNFFPDIRKFLSDLRRSIGQFFSYKRVAQVGAFLFELAEEPLKALMLMNMVIIVILYLLLRLYLPDIISYLQGLARNYASLRYFASLGAVGLQFLAMHVTGLYIWAILFILFFTRTIHDVFLAQCFYLFSIPYLLLTAQHFFAYFLRINQQRHQFISEPYEERFFWVVSRLTYAAIVILALRQAFELGGYRGSQVSNVLMAVLFILLQIGLISLLRREQIVEALHIDTPLGEWIYAHVNKYYHFVYAGLIAMIVVSNPYIGYGRQIIYIISRLLITAAMLPLFSWIHSRVKQMSVDLFFYYTDTDEIKERFIAGRFWYGSFVISSLLLFLIAGVYLGGRIWGTRFTLYEMASWLNYSFYVIIDEAGKEVPVTVFSLLHIVFYILGAIGIATLINKFVLRRALDPFLVEPGIQNTVLTLIRYVIIMIGVFMGLTSAGLEGLTTKIAIVLAGIGFAAQEAVRDFFSYFVLLVQRPIKIGDLIEIGDTAGNRENAIVGVVRYITPRSIMVRQRNSVTVIIPNSRVVMHPVINWSYSRSFIAFNDIFLTVPFVCDPNFVRQLMLQVLDKSPQLLKTPTPIVRLEDFTDNGYRFLIRGFLTSEKALEQWDIASDVRLELVKQLRVHGIQIASPVRTLKVVAPDGYDPFPGSDKNVL